MSKDRDVVELSKALASLSPEKLKILKEALFGDVEDKSVEEIEEIGEIEEIEETKEIKGTKGAEEVGEVEEIKEVEEVEEVKEVIQKKRGEKADDDVVSLGRSTQGIRQNRRISNSRGHNIKRSENSPPKEGESKGSRKHPRVENIGREPRTLMVDSSTEGLYQDEISMANFTPTRRGVRKTMIDVECDRCHREFTVSNKLVRMTDEGYKYICDGCIVSK